MEKLPHRFFCLIFFLFFISACNTGEGKTTSINTVLPQSTIVKKNETIGVSPVPSPSEPKAITTPIPTTALLKLPDGELSVVAIGDSLTQGDGDESGKDGYPSRLAELIGPKRAGTTILNLGKSGWSSTDVLAGVNGEEPTLPKALAAKPKITLIWIGSNDLWYLYEYGPEPMTAEAEDQDLAVYTANIDKMLSQLTSDGSMVFIALLDDQSKRPVVANPPNPSEPAFSAITAADLERMSVHVVAMNEIIKKEAALHRSVYVDFYNTDIFTNSNTLYSDGNHPNTTGYEKIAGIWFTAIEPYLH